MIQEPALPIRSCTLDPPSRELCQALFRRYAGEGRTVFLGPYAVSYLLGPLITDPAWGFWPLVLPALGSLQEATAVNSAVAPVEASSIALMGLGGYTIAVVPSGVGRLSTLDVT